MVRRPWFVLLAFVVAAALGACFQEAPPEVAEVEQGVSAEDLSAWMTGRVCTNYAQTGCLELITVNVCSSGCPRRGYNYRVEKPGRIDPHMTLEYLKELRKAANDDPDGVPAWYLSLGMTTQEMLWHQVQMMLYSQTQFYATSAGTRDGDVDPLTAGQVSTPSHTVDPTRFYAVAWVNGAGTAHAMAQADMGLWFQSVAKNYLAAGDLAQATYYLQLSERTFRTYGMRDNDGGVRNNKRSYKCFEGLYCYWFHSFAVGEHAYPSSVLNQNLHAIRDAMEAHNDLRTWSSRPGVDPGYLAQLSEWARGGLFQLAYGTGNQVDSTAPPSLAEFEVVSSDPDNVCESYGYAAYDYVLGGTRKCIRPANTCHYHYHSLSVMKRIMQLVDLDPVFAADPYFVGAKFKIMYGRSAGDTRTCNNRSYIPPSRKVMSGVPLARLYHSSATTPFRLQCDGIPDNDNYAPETCREDENGNPVCTYDEEYKDSADWADTSVDPRAWYDAAYAGCSF